MAIQDILTPVDLVSGIGDHGRQETVSVPLSTQESRSEYQRALSQTLNKEGHQDQKTENAENASTDQESEAIDNRDHQPAESNGSTVNAEADSVSSTPVQGIRDIETRETDRRTEGESAQPSNSAVNFALTEVVDDTSIVVNTTDHLEVAGRASGNELPLKPPADLSQLFAATTDFDGPAESIPPGDPLADQEAVRPPNALFETQTLSIEQPGENTGVPARQVSPTAADVGATPDGPTVADSIQLGEIEAADAVLLPNPIQQKSRDADESAVPQFDTRVPNERLASGAKSPAADNASDLQRTARSLSPDATIETTDPETTAVSQPSTFNSGVNVAPLPSASTTGPASDRTQDGTGGRVGSQTGDDVLESQSATLDGQATKAMSAVTVQPQTTEPVEAVGSLAGNDSDSAEGTESLKSSPTLVSGDSAAKSVAPAAARVESFATTPQQVDPEQFVERVATAVQSAPANGQQLRVRLYPPHLGSLQVEVTSHGGSLSVRMEVQTVNAQNTLMDNISSLREVLMSQGSVIDRIDVQLVETTAEEGRSDLADEQQEFEQHREERAEEQADEEQEERAAVDDTVQGQATTSEPAGIDELDIQV